MGVVRSGLGSRLSARLAVRAALAERARADERERRRPAIHLDPPRLERVVRPRAGWGR